MSLSVLSQGQLTADPVRRESKSGKPFVTVQIRVATEAENVLLSVICFDTTACDKLARLRKGDSVAVTGRAKPTAWEKNGEQRNGLSVVASGVLTAYEAGKRRRTASSTEDDLPESSLDDL